VTDKISFLTNNYYLSLIDWDDPDDPIRTIIIPHVRELDEWGQLDPSNEKAYTVMPGVEHKYNSTALFLASDTCGGICRYCFRKQVLLESHEKHELNLAAAMEYIKQHTEISNVLLTGGDPLTLTTERLESIISQLRQVEHVQIIRIGTRIPVFNPYRIIDDPSLLEMIDKYSTAKKKIYIVTHFDHSRELTDLAIRGIDALQKCGTIIMNQTPLIRKINDNPKVMAELLDRLSFVGVAPYYIFQCRPALGNKAYTVPIEEGYEIVEQAKSCVSGLAKRVRFVMSHSTGKIEIVGKTKDMVFFKYHRAFRDEDSGRFMVFRSNPNACWLEDYDEPIQDYPITLLDGLHAAK